MLADDGRLVFLPLPTVAYRYLPLPTVTHRYLPLPTVMLADDGRLVFLDFGLMSRVEENIMEAFASGIQCA